MQAIFVKFMQFFAFFNLRFYSWKTEGGEGVMAKLEVLLEANKRKRGRGSGAVSPLGKQKELEVFPDGPLVLGRFV